MAIENTCGDRIEYDQYLEVNLLKNSNFRTVVEDAENALAIIHEIQSKRRNGNGDIETPLTSTEINTILEVGTSLERSLASLKSLEDLE